MGAERVFGYTAQEAIGKSIELLIPPENLEAENLIMQRVLKGEWVSHLITERICKGGRRINASVTLSPIFDATGKVVGASKIVRDISMEIKAQQALRDANKALAYQNEEKAKRVAELVVAHDEKAKRAAELVIANEELLFQNQEKAKRVAELVVANDEKAKRAAELVVANKELVFQNREKAKRVAELVVANEEKANRAAELVVANEELLFQNQEKAKRVAELVVANDEKAKRAAELVVANEELLFQNREKAKRVAELVIANEEKANRAADLLIAIAEKIVDQNNLQRSLMQTIDIARELGELRDPYTSGHEKHVGDLARAIAAQMGWNEVRQEGVMIAGYLHDIGKIVVPVEILCKPGNISPEEYSLVKNHVLAGYRLLKEVSFPWPIAQAVAEHHERLNGTGYPKQLRDDQICMEGRILAVADVVEAMSSHRPYRAAIENGAALDEITRGRGVLYDAQVVDACLTLFHDKAYKIASSLTA